MLLHRRANDHVNQGTKWRSGAGVVVRQRWHPDAAPQVTWRTRWCLLSGYQKPGDRARAGTVPGSLGRRQKPKRRCMDSSRSGPGGGERNRGQGPSLGGGPLSG